MKCPGCGNADAYMGFSSIDCPNSVCRHYQGNNEPDSWPTPASLPTRPTAGPTGTASAPAPAQGSTGSATLAPALRVNIISNTAKKSWVEIVFEAHGDPGRPNKTVEFLWSLPGQPGQAVICTLSARNTYFVSGVDADGQTKYTTQWRCTLDGVQPGSQYTLSANIH